MKDPSRASVALLALAQQRAAELLQQAREEAERILAQAFQEGHQRGLEAGRAAALHEIRQAQEACRAEASAERQRHHAEVQAYLASVEPELIDLVVQVSEKVIKTQLTMDRHLVVDQVNASLLTLGKTAVARIWVHPEDVPRLEDARRAQRLVAVETDLVLLPDAAITPGFCVAEAGGSRVDARIDSQMSRLHETLRRGAGLDDGESYADAA